MSDSATESAQELHLLVLGDSIAIPRQGCDDCAAFDELYADHLAELAGREVAVDNEARLNATMSDLQALLDDEDVGSEVAQADVVVVSIGYNDGPPWTPDAACHPPEAAQDIELIGILHDFTHQCIDATLREQRPTLDAVYARIEELAGAKQQVRIALGAFNNLVGNPGGDGTLPPVWTGKAPAAVLAELPGAIANMTYAIDGWFAMDSEIAEAHGFVVADIYHAFNGPDGQESLEKYVSPDDYVHPNELGHQRIAELLASIDVSALTG